MLKKITTRTAQLSFDGVLLTCELLDEKDIDADDVQENNEAAMQLVNGQRFLSLVISAPYTSITHEGRREADRINDYSNTIAQAIVTKNLANRIMGNFLLRFHRPSCPCRLFNDKTSALEWLKTFLNTNNNDRHGASGGHAVVL